MGLIFNLVTILSFNYKSSWYYVGMFDIGVTDFLNKNIELICENKLIHITYTFNKLCKCYLY